jgi:hypothetical protein
MRRSACSREISQGMVRTVPESSSRARRSPLTRALLTEFEQHFPDHPAATAARRLAEQVAR